MKNWIGMYAAMLSLIASPVFSAPEAFEIGSHNVDQLPGGKEADGIIGDFVLRNDTVEALISGNLPLRKANMGTFWSAITPGCLYDLTFLNENNDQLTIFAPSNQQGPVSYVRIVNDGSAGDAAEIETVVTAAGNDGLYKRHLYRLQDGWRGVLVITTLRNESDEKKTLASGDSWTRLRNAQKVGETFVADAIDPYDKVGYAYRWMDIGEMTPPDNTIELNPGQEMSYARALVIGRSPMDAMGYVESIMFPYGIVQGTITDFDGNPIPTAEITFQVEDKEVQAYPDQHGEFELRMPPGEHTFTVFDHGRGSAQASVLVSEGQTDPLKIQMRAPSAVTFSIQTAQGEDSPCKAQFIGINGTQSPYLGPSDRAHGCLDQYHSETGTFTVQLEPGEYKIIVTRGIEYDHIEKEIKLDAGKTETVSGKLTRVVHTPGWVSADFHNHSTPSGDNTTNTYDRIINIAAEHIEFAPTTEHNRLFDWTPYIEELGLSDKISTVPGLELTGPNQHFNTFPLQPERYQQDGGAPVWQYDPRLNAINLRSYQEEIPERWVQVNHPDLVRNFHDRNGDGIPDGGYKGFELLIDAAEIVNKGGWDARVHILNQSPVYLTQDVDGSERVRHNREFIWLQLLNQGHRYVSVAVADAHRVHGNGVGGWRMYIPSDTDAPAEIDWKQMSVNAKAGRIIITNGPYLEVTTLDGTVAGGTTLANASLDVHVRVQCNSWVNIDRVQVLVNGRQREDLNFTRDTHPDMFHDDGVQFDERINIPLQKDSHLIVVAFGENSDLKTGWGTSWEANMQPCAYNNPIYVDVDGGGFTPNGDTLGFPIPTHRMSVDEAKEWIARSR